MDETLCPDAPPVHERVLRHQAAADAWIQLRDALRDSLAAGHVMAEHAERVRLVDAWMRDSR